MKKDPYLELLRTGDAQAFEAVVRQYGGRMHAVAGRFLACSEDGADAVQDALFAAYRSIASFEGKSTPWPWLYRILVNACLALRRSRYKHRVLSLNALADGAEAPDADPVFPGRRQTEPALVCAARAETRARVRDCIQCLPERYRTVLVVRELEELATDEAAQRLGTSRSAVKSRLHRARRALRKLLEPVLCEQA